MEIFLNFDHHRKHVIRGTAKTLTWRQPQQHKHDATTTSLTPMQSPGIDECIIRKQTKRLFVAALCWKKKKIETEAGELRQNKFDKKW